VNGTRTSLLGVNADKLVRNKDSVVSLVECEADRGKVVKWRDLGLVLSIHNPVGYEVTRIDHKRGVNFQARNDLR